MRRRRSSTPSRRAAKLKPRECVDRVHVGASALTSQSIVPECGAGISEKRRLGGPKLIGRRAACDLEAEPRATQGVVTVTVSVCVCVTVCVTVTGSVWVCVWV